MNDPLATVIFELRGGFWFHQRYGHLFIDDHDEASYYRSVGSLLDYPLSFSDYVRPWIAANRPLLNQTDQVEMFLEQVASKMLSDWGWILIWRGRIYSARRNHKVVLRELVLLAHNFPDLGWPEVISVDVINVAAPEQPEQVKWGEFTRIKNARVADDTYFLNLFMDFDPEIDR